MAQSRLLVPFKTVLALFLACLAAGSCRQKEPAPAPLAPEVELLENAIRAFGDLESLERLSSFSARYESTLFGARIKGTVQQKGGAMRLSYISPAGDYAITQVSAEGQCWQQIDRAVIPCTKGLQEHSTKLARLLEASWLWPLKKRSDRKLRAGQIEHAGTAYDGLTVLGGDGAELGTLLLEKSTARIAGLKMQTTLMGESGELVVTFGEPARACGIEVPMKREHTFNGKSLGSEKLGGVLCEAVEDKVFLPPAQVEHGLVELKNTASLNLACTTMKGPYSGVAQALDKLAAYLQQKELAPEGAPQLVLRKCPPQVKVPARFVTDVCFPVGNKAWHLPKSTWKGEYSLFERIGDEYLRIYGVGDYEKTTQELAARLPAEARKLERAQAGPAVQILYVRPGDFPPEQQLSEMHLPLD